MVQCSDRILTTLVTATFFASAPAMSQWESSKNIQTAAEHLVRTDIGENSNDLHISAATTDARLRLTACSQPLDASYLGRRSGSRITVKVACLSDAPWKIYVPVSVERFQDVVIAAAHLPRGHTLARDDLQVVRRNITNEPQRYFQSVEPLLGQLTKRAIASGVPITPQVTQLHNSVERGRIVTLTAMRSGILIRMAGTAMSSAAMGERVKVRNNSSGRVVEGIVSAANEVQVTSF